MRASIFINYRRSDAGGHAGRLHDRLALHESLRAATAPLLALDFHTLQGKNADWN